MAFTSKTVLLHAKKTTVTRISLKLHSNTATRMLIRATHVLTRKTMMDPFLETSFVLIIPTRLTMALSVLCMLKLHVLPLRTLITLQVTFWQKKSTRAARHSLSRTSATLSMELLLMELRASMASAEKHVTKIIVT